MISLAESLNNLDHFNTRSKEGVTACCSHALTFTLHLVKYVVLFHWHLK